MNCRSIGQPDTDQSRQKVCSMYLDVGMHVCACMCDDVLVPILGYVCAASVT